MKKTLLALTLVLLLVGCKKQDLKPISKQITNSTQTTTKIKIRFEMWNAWDSSKTQQILNYPFESMIRTTAVLVSSNYPNSWNGIHAVNNNGGSTWTWPHNDKCPFLLFPNNSFNFTFPGNINVPSDIPDYQPQVGDSLVIEATGQIRAIQDSLGNWITKNNYYSIKIYVDDSLISYEKGYHPITIGIRIK